jgi:hypothetical protein
MKTLLLTSILAFGLQSAFAAQVNTKSCEQKFETNDRNAKGVSNTTNPTNPTKKNKSPTTTKAKPE